MKPMRMPALFVLLAAAVWAPADPPKTPILQNAGKDDFKLGELSDKSITVRKIEVELTKSSRPRPQAVENEYQYDLAPNVLLRRQDLPRGADGKAKQLTNDEYARLREPPGAPGYRAERGEFRSGQIVRVWFGRESPRDRPVVTTVMLIRDGADAPRKPDDKKKTDDKKKSDDKKKDDKKKDSKQNP